MEQQKQPNAETRVHVTRQDLPLHCPLPGTSNWNSHPRVFLPIEKTGREKCPYCGTDYILTD
ncbi:MAG: zinc-finger domain-containing protein [Gammaproteobacteria bacterium]|nr:MAG: zinc-finger domain-containing protein [Gammaproteobacteria bacterium]